MRSSYRTYRKRLIDIIINMDMFKLPIKLILRTIDRAFFTPVWPNYRKPVKSWISFFSSARLRNSKSYVVRRERGYYVKISKRLRNDLLVFALRIINVILAN